MRSVPASSLQTVRLSQSRPLCISRLEYGIFIPRIHLRMRICCGMPQGSIYQFIFTLNMVSRCTDVIHLPFHDAVPSSLPAPACFTLYVFGLGVSSTAFPFRPMRSILCAWQNILYSCRDRECSPIRCERAEHAVESRGLRGALTRTCMGSSGRVTTLACFSRCPHRIYVLLGYREQDDGNNTKLYMAYCPRLTSRRSRSTQLSQEQ